MKVIPEPIHTPVVRVVPNAGDPAVVANGEIWYDSTAAVFRKRQAGASSNLVDGGVPLTMCGRGVYGDGSDGSVTFDGAATILSMAPSSNIYTMTRDIYCTAITINSTVVLKTAGWRVFCTGTILNNGTIHNDGGAGSGTTAGAAATGGSVTGGGVGAAGLASGTTTSAGASPSAAGGNQDCASRIGGTGGNSNGGAGGTVPSVTKKPGWRDLLSLSLCGWIAPGTTLNNAPGSAILLGGGTGGGGGGRTTGGTATATGAGGGGAGVCFVAAKTITNTSGIIRANGGDGSAATGGTCSAGGGAGGSGGVLVMIYETLSAGTETANGGAIGAGLNGAAAATPGAAGTVYKLVNNA